MSLKGLFTCAFLCLLAFFTQAQVARLRELYFSAGSDDQISNFYQFANNYQAASAVERAYTGVAIAMYADVVNGVQDKFSYFNRGKEILEKAVADDYYNPEIRFLRFSVQAEVPMIVGYKDKISEDVWRIIGGLKAGMADPKSDFWKKAISYLLASDKLDENQRKELQAFKQ